MISMRVNPLRTKVLITTDEVIFHAPTNNDVDVRMILQSIIVAERRFVKPIIGPGLYKTLVDKKNYELVTTENVETLQTEIDEAYAEVEAAGIKVDREKIKIYPGDYLNSLKDFEDHELKFWNDYLHKIVAECVYFCALPTTRSRFSKAGIMQENPKSQVSSGGSSTVDLKDLKHLLDSSLHDRIYPLIEDMHIYLCGEKYEGYERDCGCDSKGTSFKKGGSSIILGMYDDDDCKCDWNAFK